MRGEYPAAAETGGQVPTAYHDRSRSPAETVAVVRPHFEALGITRVARQTGLDRVGIPCFAAFRPNSRSIACNQGKGVDDDSARASAVMEAVEYAVAERPQGPCLRATADNLTAEGQLFFDPDDALPLGERLDRKVSIRWIAGSRLRDGAAVQVPFDLVRLDGTRDGLPGICQHTNGLASGNTLDEAMFHGTCELIERDANTLWSLLDMDSKSARCVHIDSFSDPVVARLLERMERAGLAVRLFDQTADLRVPTILAVSAPADGIAVKHYDVAAGAGTHPDPVRAALRAITEAAQTRITSIAAARDDVRPDSYRLDGSAEAAALVAAEPQVRMAAADVPVRSTAGALLEHLLAKLRPHGVDDLIAVPLGCDAYGVSVVRMLSGTLEDRGPNANWRPGERALAALLGT